MRTPLIVLAAAGCSAAPPPSPPGSEVGSQLLAETLAAHGADVLAASRVDFRFRGVAYRMTRRGGRYVYERWPRPGQHEALGNSGFSLRVGGAPAKLSAAAAAARARSLNSVVYFASLPLPLADPAVRALPAGRRAIEGRSYEVLEVRFVPEGGGDDHDDVFRHWIDPESRELAYLAYRFSRGEGGVRFRVRTGAKRVGGVLFVDWANYGSPDRSLPLDALPERWARGDLPKLSDVVIEQVRVQAASDDDLRAPARSK